MKNIKIDEFKTLNFSVIYIWQMMKRILFYTVSNMNLEKFYEHRIYKMNLETKKSFMLTNGAKENSFIELFDGNLLFASGAGEKINVKKKV